MSSTIEYSTLPNIATVLLIGPREPSESEWKAYLDFLRDQARQNRALVESTRGVLVLSDGGGPNSKQRAALNDVINQLVSAGFTRQPVAVLSDSTVVRGIVTAFGWMGNAVRAFTKGDIEGATSYFGLDTRDASAIRQEIARLRPRLAR